MAAQYHKLTEHLVAAWRLIGLFGITVFYLIHHFLQTVGSKGRSQYQRISNLELQNWSLTILRFLNIGLETKGKLPRNGKLITPNHQSYLDILVLSASSPMVFLSKAEVNSWPFIGFLLRRAAQLIIDREQKRTLSSIVHSIDDRLADRQCVCVFLEGTTTGGQGVARFHSSLLEASMMGNHPVVPTAIKWSVSDTRFSVSEDIAYWKDHNFPKHVWRLLGITGITAVVTFGDPILPQGKTRRVLCDDVFTQVKGLHGHQDVSKTST